MSQVTTHILDTTRGRPAAGVVVAMYFQHSEWEQVATGITDTNGRISGLLAKGLVLPAGTYKLRFEVDAYFSSLGVKSFYPFVEIAFEVTHDSHYHVPLLLNPFGYSTYRGS